MMDDRYYYAAEQFSLEELQVVRLGRVKLALYLGSFALILNGLCWAIFFFLHNNQAMFLVEIGIALLGLTVLAMAYKGYLRAAEYMFLTCVFLILCGMCLFVDIPNAKIPRVVHLHLLGLAMYTYLFFPNDRKWLRNVLACLFLTTFVIFSSTNFGFPTQYTVPDSVRLNGTWFNTIAAVGVLGLLVRISHLDTSVRNRLLEDLRFAIKLNQLELYYQPQVDKTGKVCGAEALLRWNHPIRGVVLPSEFIPMAEQHDLIAPIERWVLDATCKQLSHWSMKPELAEITLSANISARQFYDSKVVEDVQASIKRFGVLSSKFKLELTESILIQDIEDVIAKMVELKRFNVGLALDDFGTGYSSLNYLTRLPIDQLKIDQSFVRNMLIKPNSATIVKTIISLAKNLGLSVVAEGVETKEQVNFLSEQGCTVFQGFYFGRPMSIKAFEATVLHTPIVTPASHLHLIVGG